jgi:transposase
VAEHYKWVWVYVAIEPTRGTCHVLLLPHVNGEWLQLYLHTLREATGRDRIGVVMDNAPSHKSHAVVWPEGIHPIFLPPYSPELNPAEQVFRMLRQWLANRIFAEEEELEAALTEMLHQFWDDPEVVIRLTNYPWWQVGTQSLIPLSS